MKRIRHIKPVRWLTLLTGATLLGQSNCDVQIGDIFVETFARTLSNVVGTFFQGIFSDLFMTA